ncbi:MAG: polysaccharide export protein [Bacteroidales bacterium]|nr:polysaccharide export protein [Bacteroidales bacterium]
MERVAALGAGMMQRCHRDPLPHKGAWTVRVFVVKSELSRLVGVVLAMAALLLAAPALSEPYRLGPQDKLRIKIIEWRAGKGDYYEWTPLNTEYIVNAAGAVSVPLVGEVIAADKTTEEIAAAISDALQQRAGLVGRPHTAVEVIQFRPIYVTGEVERPGEYSFRPDMTVLQLVSLAGGIRRTTEAGLMRLERDRIVAAGQLESARLDLRRNLVRRARLQAEIANADEIRMPPNCSRTATQGACSPRKLRS